MAVQQELLDRAREAGPPTLKKRGVEKEADRAVAEFALVEELGVLNDGDVILDIGCGEGRLAFAIAGGPYRYVGVDINDRKLAFARKVFESYSNCEFQQVDVSNEEYNPDGGQAPQTFRIDAEDGSVGAVFAVSLFTHIPDGNDCRHYLREMRRVLRPGGALRSTWLTDPPYRTAETNAHRSVYTRPDIEAMLSEAGFEIAKEEGEGFAYDQWRLVSRAV